MVKKLVLLLSMIMALAFATVAFAAGEGTALNNEQRATEKLIAAFTQSTGTVESISGSMTPALQKKVTAASFKENQATIADKLGELKASQFRAFERVGTTDVVTYLAKFSKEDTVRIVVFFENGEKPLVNQFIFQPIRPAQQAQNQAK